MKKLLFVMGLFVATGAFAVPTDVVRSNSGGLIRIGDSEQLMLSKMGEADAKPHRYIHEFKDGSWCAATGYVYTLGMQVYNIAACRGKVVAIEYRNR